MDAGARDHSRRGDGRDAERSRPGRASTGRDRLPAEDCSDCASSPSPRLAADAVRAAARPPRPLAARRRDRRHRPWPGAGRALERADDRRPCLLGRPAHAARRRYRAGDLRPTSAPPGRLAVMLHDAPEYVIGDMISPFKALLGGRIPAVEQRLLAAIHRRFGLPYAAGARRSAPRSRPPTVSRPSTRRRGSPASPRPRRAASSGGRAASIPGGFELEPWPASKAERKFLDAFRQGAPRWRTA